MNRKAFLQFIKFGIVGVCTTVAYLIILYLLVEFFGFNVVLAGAISYVLAVIFNYCSHYGWTFSSTASHRVVMRRYLVMIASGFCFNALGMYLLAKNEGYQYLFVQGLLLCLITSWNFFLSRVWVFK